MTTYDLEKAWERVDTLLNNDGKFMSTELHEIRESARVVGEFCTGLVAAMSDERVKEAAKRYAAGG